MNDVKLFAYLDEYKMYSISSQLFGGLTESITNFSSQQLQGKVSVPRDADPEMQIAAGISLAEEGARERRFLHDYSYLLFENRLRESNRVLDVNASSDVEAWLPEAARKFVVVKGRAIFNDLAQLRETVSNFNQIGEALAYITTYGTVSAQREALQDVVKQLPNRDLRARSKAQLKSKLKPTELAKTQNLWQEPELLKYIAYVLEYGYGDQFEVQIPVTLGGKRLRFSAILNRELLREQVRTIVAKYARDTEVEFTLFGLVCQSSRQAWDPSQAQPNLETSPQNMKEAVLNLAKLLANVEDTFTGRQEGEIMIDPIALYREV